MWTAVHGLIGIGIVALLTRYKPFGVKLSPWSKYGFVLGNILPDIDLLLCIALAFGGLGIEAAGAVHRTATHSFITIAAIILVGFAIGYWQKGKKWIQSLFIALGLGMFTHVLFDLPGPVSIFYPLITARIGVSPLQVTPLVGNISNALDFLFVALFFYVIYLLAKRANGKRLLDLKSTILAASMVFVGLCAYAFTNPAPNSFLFVYALLGFPFLVLLFAFLHLHRRGIYKLGAAKKDSTL